MSQLQHGLVLLHAAADWVAYRASVAAQSEIDAEAVQWGNGPAAYPCLVTSYRASRLKIVCCYFYVNDALELLRAAPPGAVPVASVAGSISPGETPQETHSTHDEYAKSMAAHVMTIVRLLVDTGIVKPDSYEARYLAALADVDQVSAADRLAAVGPSSLLERGGDVE